MSDLAIRVEALSKRYVLGQGARELALRNVLGNFLKRRGSRDSSGNGSGAIIIVVLLVALALLAGVITTTVIIRRVAATEPLPPKPIDSPETVRSD